MAAKPVSPASSMADPGAMAVEHDSSSTATNSLGSRVADSYVVRRKQMGLTHSINTDVSKQGTQIQSKLLKPGSTYSVPTKFSPFKPLDLYPPVAQLLISQKTPHLAVRLQHWGLLPQPMFSNRVGIHGSPLTLPLPHTITLHLRLITIQTWPKILGRASNKSRHFHQVISNLQHQYRIPRTGLIAPLFRALLPVTFMKNFSTKEIVWMEVPDLKP